MRKTIVVAVREYQAAVRTKAFIVTLVAMPILMGGAIVFQILLKDKVDTRDRRVAVIDFTGEIYDSLAEAAGKRNTMGIFDTEGEDRTQTQPRFLVEKAEAIGKNLERLSFELSERVRKKELFAFTIIPSGVIDTVDIGEPPKIAYYSNSPTYRGLWRWLGSTINKRVQELRFDREGLDLDLINKATKRVPIEDFGLVSMDEEGSIIEAEETNRTANLIVPAGMMMLMLMVVMVGASPLVNSVLEEKMQRIAEVLLGSIPPFQLMMGKLLGTVGVSLTISAAYLVGAFVAVSYAGYVSFFPTHLLWWFMLYQALAVLMYGSVFVAVGAAVTDIKESQAMLMPVMVLVMAPFFVWGNILKAPTATFSVVVSLFPPATPMLMLLRQAIPPGVPIWQPLLGILLVLLTTAVFVFVAGRIFRVGILMQGKGAKFGEMFRWALRG